MAYTLIDQSATNLLRTDAAGKIVESSFPMWRSTRGSTVSKRKRPVDLQAASAMTTYSRYSSETRSMSTWLTWGEQKPTLVPMNSIYSVAANSTNVNTTVNVCQDRAAAKLLNAIKDQRWNAAVTFAELGKTIAFCAEAFDDIRRLYLLARRGDIFGMSDWYRDYNGRGQRRKPIWKRFSNRWLQWRYAVQPIAYDLEDVLAEFYHSGAEPVVKQVKSRAYESVTGPLAEGKYLGVHPYWAWREGYVEVKRLARYTIQPDVHLWKRLGIVNVPALLWELLPGSFLFDWVLPVGQFLHGLDAHVGITYQSGLQVVKRDFKEVSFCHGAKMESQYKGYARTLVGQLPSQPLPRWEVPQTAVKSKLADVLALIVQLRGPERGLKPWMRL